MREAVEADAAGNLAGASTGYKREESSSDLLFLKSGIDWKRFRPRCAAYQLVSRVVTDLEILSHFVLHGQCPGTGCSNRRSGGS